MLCESCGTKQMCKYYDMMAAMRPVVNIKEISCQFHPDENEPPKPVLSLEEKMTLLKTKQQEDFRGQDGMEDIDKDGTCSHCGAKNVETVHCSKCGKPVCADCAYDMNGHDICPDCYDKMPVGSVWGAIATDERPTM